MMRRGRETRRASFPLEYFLSRYFFFADFFFADFFLEGIQYHLRSFFHSGWRFTLSGKNFYPAFFRTSDGDATRRSNFPLPEP
jgi:hypothetical protein